MNRRIKIPIKFTYIFLSCLIISCASEDKNLSSVDDIYLNIPDVTFETVLINQGIDSDGIINQQMLKSDAEAVSILDLNLSANLGEISDLTGIEGFVNITLFCGWTEN